MNRRNIEITKSVIMGMPYQPLAERHDISRDRIATVFKDIIRRIDTDRALGYSFKCKDIRENKDYWIGKLEDCIRGTYIWEYNKANNLTFRTIEIGTREEFETKTKSMNMDMLEALEENNIKDDTFVIMSYNWGWGSKGYLLTSLAKCEMKSYFTDNKKLQIVTVGEFKQYVKGEE